MGISKLSKSNATSNQHMDLLTLLNLVHEAPKLAQKLILNVIISLRKYSDNRIRNMHAENMDDRVDSWEDLLSLIIEMQNNMNIYIGGTVLTCNRNEGDYQYLKQRFETLKKSHENNELMYEIIYELLSVGQDFQTSEEVMEQSAEVLIDEFEADLFVCRLHDKDGNWINVATNTRNLSSIPIFASSMEENVPGHPVMHAVAETNWSYVLSNNLKGSERGGESYDCVPFQEGYRSRLAFILRDHNRIPFGLIMLYSRTQGFFENYCHKFLADCSKIVSMTVGSRLELGRDTLAKAAGGMAHVGNNALSVIVTSLGIIQDEFKDAIKDSPQHQIGLNDIDNPGEYVLILQKYIDSFDINGKLNLINNSISHAKRINGAINNLLSAVNNPKIMHYIRGEEVLDLDPNTKK